MDAGLRQVKPSLKPPVREGEANRIAGGNLTGG